jgi:hypothetical protein
MGKRKRILTLTAVLVAVLGILIFLASDKEPRYQGRPLSYWLSTYTAARFHWPQPGKPRHLHSPEEATEAIRAIGPAAVPCLVKWINYEPSAGKRGFIKFMGRFRGGRLDRWVPESFTTDQTWLRALGASAGFDIIGPAAHSATPELLRCARRVKNPASVQLIVRALGSLGPEGVIALSDILTNLPDSETTAYVKLEAMNALTSMGTNAAPAVPALVHCLASENDYIALTATTTLRSLRLAPELTVPALTTVLQDPRTLLRIAAAEGLGSLGGQARSATNQLYALLKDPEAEVGVAATGALSQIAPEVPTNALPH